MSAASFTIAFDQTSDATYRAWVNAIHTQVTALGWVQTADTGQLNLSTGTRAATATSGGNYLIYRTNDGNTPIYVKLSFTGTATTLPCIGMQVGLGTDGAGNITGTQATELWYQGNNTASDTVARTCVISGDTGRLGLAINLNATSVQNSRVYVVERARDASGAVLTDGSFVACVLGGTSTSFRAPSDSTTRWGYAQYVPASGGTPPYEINGFCALVTNAAAGSSSYGGNAAACTWVPFAGGGKNPAIAFHVCAPADAPARDTTTSITVYGTARTYYSLGPNFPQSAAMLGATAATRLLILYE